MLILNSSTYPSKGENYLVSPLTPSLWNRETSARSCLLGKKSLINPDSLPFVPFVPTNRGTVIPSSAPSGPTPVCSLLLDHLGEAATSRNSTADPPRDPDLPDGGPSADPGHIGARLLGFAPCWRGSTSDAWIIQTVSQGYRIEFLCRPPHRFWPTPFSSDPAKHSQKMQAIQHLLDIQAIEPVPTTQARRGVYSVFFLVPKKNGEMRTILDLKWLNRFVSRKKFKMETWRTITSALDQGDFLSSIDLKEAYLHVPIHPSHRKFLRFNYGHLHFQYRALPFGLSTAPRVFTKLLIAPVAHLRSQGVRIFPYLDDLLVAASSFYRASEDLHRVMTCLTLHGFIVNREKSSLVPSQEVTHLGLRINTFSFHVHLSPERQEKLRQALLLVRTASTSSLMTLSSLLGLMVSCQDIIPWSRFHLRPLQSFLRPFSHLIEVKSQRHLTLPSSVLESLDWWMAPHRLQTGCSLETPTRMVITTDASLSGWGARLEQHLAQGTWSTTERTFSINRLELRAIRLALIHFEDSIQWHHILIQTDNTTAKAFINRQGGTKSRGLMREASSLLQWAEVHLSSIKAEHLPGVLNLEADWLSRRTVDEGEWSLHPQVFHLITSVLGNPAIDLFASPENHQVPAFLSRNPSHLALGVDALSFPWPPLLLYAFPPFPLIQRVLQRIKKFGATVIMVTPHWPRRPWFPTLVNLSAAPPLRLPFRKDLLRQGPLVHPDPGIFKLTAWFLKGKG